MGILNVTPDSFSDGGRWADARSAVEQGVRLHADGADIVDIGGESTRPGASRIPGDEELDRVTAGAVLVNDVSGGRADPGMLPWLATCEVPYVAMHWRGPSDVMEDLATYGDVVTEVRDELAVRLDALAAAGVDLARVVLDPGLGFAKRSPDNWAVLRHLDSLASLGCPLLIGASRKRFLGDLLAHDDGEPRPFEERDAAGDAVTALAASHGVWGVRVHEVRGSRDAVLVARAWRETS
jgi:dihydropteroate synthase